MNLFLINLTSTHFQSTFMGKQAVIKTKQTSSSVEDFINKIADEQKRKDSQVILSIMEKATKEKTKNVG
jgi:hypothetical protein